MLFLGKSGSAATVAKVNPAHLQVNEMYYVVFNEFDNRGNPVQFTDVGIVYDSSVNAGVSKLTHEFSVAGVKLTTTTQPKGEPLKAVRFMRLSGDGRTEIQMKLLCELGSATFYGPLQFEHEKSKGETPRTFEEEEE